MLWMPFPVACVIVGCLYDSQVLISSWPRQGAKSRDLVVALKRIFGIISSCKIHLNLVYIPSDANPADPPSRVLS